MKFKLGLIVIIQFLFLNCKTSSTSKQDLINENKVLKERIIQLESIDTLKIDAVVEVSKMNVVYRGITNHIRLTIPNAIRTEASAPGLKKIDDFGNYTFYPRAGRNVDILISGIMPNNDTIYRIKKLRILDIGKPTGIFDRYEFNRSELLLTKKELKKSNVEVRLYDFLFDWSFNTKSFKIKFPNYDSIQIVGNQLTDDLNDYIESLKVGDKVIIFDIGMKTSGQALMKPPSPIIIRIVED